jgi:hypothetical protein
MTDLKARLIKPRLKEDTVAVPGIGDVRVRGLSRWEVLHDVQKAKGTAATERRILTLGMVDPEMTEDDVTAWQKAADAGEFDDVVTRISELSGIIEPDGGEAAAAAAKEAMLSFRDEP